MIPKRLRVEQVPVERRVVVVGRVVDPVLVGQFDPQLVTVDQRQNTDVGPAAGALGVGGAAAAAARVVKRRQNALPILDQVQQHVLQTHICMLYREGIRFNKVRLHSEIRMERWK